MNYQTAEPSSYNGNLKQNYDGDAKMDSKEQTVLRFATEVLDDLNDRQKSYISQIEGKLSNILNIPEPETACEMVKDLPPVDFNSSIKTMLEKMGGNTNRLSNILSHLSKII